MEAVRSEPAEKAACKHLRRRESRNGKDAQENVDASAVFWCDATRDTLGPDGDDVEDVECTDARACYEQHDAQEN